MKFGVFAAGALALVLAGCGGDAPQQEAVTMAEPTTLTGQVTYRERRLLTPGSVMTVALEDVSRQDVAATVLASQSAEVQGPPPYAFSLTYDAAAIEPQGRYGLRVRIEEDGALRFTNDAHIDPFAEFFGEVLVKGVGP